MQMSSINTDEFIACTGATVKNAQLRRGIPCVPAQNLGSPPANRFAFSVSGPFAPW